MRKLILIAAVLFVAMAGPVRAAGCPGAAPYVFNDVDASDPFCAYVTFMAQQGITGGCVTIDSTHRLYCPVDAVTRLQMAAFMGRLATAVDKQFFASIRSDGTINRGTHLTSSQRFSPGAYEVIFDRDIRSCGYSATVGEGDIGGATPGQIGITRRSGNNNGVFLQIYDKTGVLADRDFFVTVIC